MTAARRQATCSMAWLGTLLLCLLVMVPAGAATTVSTVVKSFSPASIGQGGISTLTLSIANANTFVLSNVGFTDSFPSGLVVAGTPSLTNTCSGTLTGATSGSSSITLSGGAIAASGSCSITVAVTAPTANTYINTAGGVSAAQWTGAGSVSNSASLMVLAPPIISKSFSPNPVGTLQVSTLTVTITNTNATALTGVAFSDTYPTGGVGNVLVPTVTNTCGGTVTAASLATSLSLSGGSVAANSSCSVSVTVSSASVGNFNNVTGAVSSTNAGTGNTAASTLVFTSSPNITKSFSPARISAGGTSTLTFTIQNTLSLLQGGLAFSDTFPTGMKVAATPAATNSCGGTLTAVAGAGSVSLSGGSIGILSTCTITLSVTAASAGSYANTTGALSTTLGGTLSTSNTAVLQVVSPPTIAKSFSPASLLAGNVSTLTLVITNPDATSLTGVGVTDTFPANLVVSSAPTVSNSCGGSLSGTGAASTAFALSGGYIAANSTCTISIQVTTLSAGTYANTTTGVSSNEVTTGSASNTATLTATAVDLQIRKTHAGTFTVGTAGAYTITVNNTSGTAASTGTITVTDTLPTGLSYASAGSGGTGWSCSASGQVVTCTSTTSIAAGAAGNPITLNVSVAAVAVPSVTNQVSVAGGGETAPYMNNDLAADYTLVVLPGVSMFSTAGQQSSAAGTSVFYPHSFTAGYAGNVTFTAANITTPAISGWSVSLFRDSNCNGILDGTEGSTQLTASVAVAAGGQVCLIDRVFIPATGTYGAQNQTTVTATFTPSSTGSAATLTQTDLTLIGNAGGAGLTLQKTVRNVTTGGTASASNTAISGQTLEYNITYSNTSNAPLNTIVVYDSTPGFTLFLSAQCVTPLPSSISACTVSRQPSGGGQGALAWTLTGSLLSGGSGSVLFRVTLQ